MSISIDELIDNSKLRVKALKLLKTKYSNPERTISVGNANFFIVKDQSSDIFDSLWFDKETESIILYKNLGPGVNISPGRTKLSSVLKDSKFEEFKEVLARNALDS